MNKLSRRKQRSSLFTAERRVTAAYNHSDAAKEANASLTDNSQTNISIDAAKTNQKATVIY